MKVKDLLKELENADHEEPLYNALSFSTKDYLFSAYKHECDLEDCKGHLIQSGYIKAVQNKEFMEEFATRYRRKFDSEYGIWANIDGTIEYYKDELSALETDNSTQEAAKVPSHNMEM